MINYEQTRIWLMLPLNDARNNLSNNNNNKLFFRPFTRLQRHLILQHSPFSAQNSIIGRRNQQSEFQIIKLSKKIEIFCNDDAVLTRNMKPEN